MKEFNKPVEVKEEPVVEEKSQVELKEQPKVELKKPVKERPYLGKKKEELVEMLERFRGRFNDSFTEQEKEFSRKEIVLIESELRKRGL